MPSAIVGAIAGGSSIVSGLIGSKSASKAAKAQASAAEQGAAAQLAATEMSIDEQRRQFDAVKELLRPYVQAGAGALEGQQGLLGLRGPEAQQQAIDALTASPQYQTLVQQGEEALLQNAAATGGVRGGNLQGALAQYRPQVLSQLIESQYGKLGTLAGLGQASAAGQAAAAQQTGMNISNLLGQQGQAQSLAATQIGQAMAGKSLAQGQAFSNVLGDIGGGLAAMKALKVF